MSHLLRVSVTIFAVYVSLAAVARDAQSYARKIEPPPATIEHILPSGVRLQGFGQRDQVAGEYIVRFKKGADYANVAQKLNLLKGQVLPDVMPNTPEKAEILAKAMAARFNGRIMTMYKENLALYLVEQNGFLIEKVYEDDILKLAEDRRIDTIQPVFTYHPAG